MCGGIALGFPAAVAAARLVSSNLFGVSAMDPMVLLATASLFLVVGVGAALAPANRAARIDPVSALRAE